MSTAPFTVRLLVLDTGAVHEWQGSGVEHNEGFDPWPWEESSLRLALNLVPELADAIERARRAGRHIVEVRADALNG